MIAILLQHQLLYLMCFALFLVTLASDSADITVYADVADLAIENVSMYMCIYRSIYISIYIDR